jgi:speckle-type POZ protein
MAEVFSWIRPGYELVNAKVEWNVRVPFMQTTDGNGKQIDSPSFKSQETQERKWILSLYDVKPVYFEQRIKICAWHCDSKGKATNIVDPVLMKVSIRNGKGRKILRQIIPSQPNCNNIEWILNKKVSEYQQADGSYTFCCKIFSHVKNDDVAPADPPSPHIDCSGELISHLEQLFDGMKFSDVSFNIDGREFPAHKSIMAARSEVFAAMFQHPTTENLTNQVTIEDIEPDVFQEMLRFIYTGRLNLATMKIMAVGLLIAADKYLLIKLKIVCEKYLLRQMSPVNCVELILRNDLLNPPEHLKKSIKKAAQCFQRLQSEVMATAKWEKMEEENPKLLFQIHKTLFKMK